MPLMYLPYVPMRYEALQLDGRRIRPDVHDLTARLPRHLRSLDDQIRALLRGALFGFSGSFPTGGQREPTSIETR